MTASNSITAYDVFCGSIGVLIGYWLPPSPPTVHGAPRVTMCRWATPP
jgi:hypothetical protein